MLNKDHYTVLIVPAQASDKVRRYQLSSRRIGAVLAAAVLLLAVGFVGLSGFVVGTATSAERARLQQENEAYKAQLSRYHEMASSLTDELGELRETERRLKQLVHYPDASSGKKGGQSPAVSPSESPSSPSLLGGQGGRESSGANLSPSSDLLLPLGMLDEAQEEEALQERFAQLQRDVRSLKATMSGLGGYIERKGDELRSTPSILPVVDGWVSSEYGSRTSPFTGMEQFHDGLDVTADIGEPVLATGDGVVSYVGYTNGLGLTVEIKHAKGVLTRYGHNSEALVRRGQRVRRGDAVAKVGMTGNTTGPHVHYEVLVNGRNVDPRKYLAPN